MRIRSDFEICESNTLLGKELNVGIKSINSFVKIPQKDIPTFLEYFEKIKSSDINDIKEGFNEREDHYTKSLDDLGYFNNNIEAKPAFNEFKKIGYDLFKYYFKKKATNSGNELVLKASIFLLLLLIVFIIFNTSYIFQEINLLEINLLELLGIGFLMTNFIFISHELGHYLFAKVVGVSVNSMKVVIYIFSPVYIVEYEGLNLYPLRKRIPVILGGIYIHILYVAIGISLNLFLNIDSKWLDIFIVGNSSMILTNLNFIGPTDGYFLVTNLLGVTNLRLKGYKGLKMIFSQKKLPENRIDKICVIVISFLMLFSLVSIFIAFRVWGSMLGIPSIYTNVLSFISIVFALFSLILKIGKI